MPTAPQRTSVTRDLPWRTIWRVLVAAALVWCWLKLTSLVLLMVVAVILAVTLDPMVRRLEGRHVPRWVASSLVVLVLVGIIIGFAFFASSQLAEQGQVVGSSLRAAENAVSARVPESWLKVLGSGDNGQAIQSYLAPLGMQFAQGLASALVVFALAAILTLYLLIEGRITYSWLLAFVPQVKRQKVALTAAECQRVIFAYAVGNVATSVCAAVFVFTSLSLLGVPAALLLAVLAGVCDFVPVIGFPASAVPGILLAATVSPAVALIVALLYVAYHTVENYVIAPYVYGDALKLSNVAVVLAFAVGAELAGIVGALIALPIAAAYPAVERIWFREQLGDDVVKEHSAIGRGAVEGTPAPSVARKRG